MFPRWKLLVIPVSGEPEQMVVLSNTLTMALRTARLAWTAKFHQKNPPQPAPALQAINLLGVEGAA